jgi:hypothetical protein
MPVAIVNFMTNTGPTPWVQTAVSPSVNLASHSSGRPQAPCRGLDCEGLRLPTRRRFSNRTVGYPAGGVGIATRAREPASTQRVNARAAPPSERRRRGLSLHVQPAVAGSRRRLGQRRYVGRTPGRKRRNQTQEDLLSRDRSGRVDVGACAASGSTAPDSGPKPRRSSCSWARSEAPPASSCSAPGRDRLKAAVLAIVESVATSP